MQISTKRAIAGACQIVGFLGFIEVRWLERQIMIGDHPIDPFFIEMGCLFLFSAGLFALISLSWGWISNLIYSDAHEFGNLYEEIAARRDELTSMLEGKPTADGEIGYIARMVELQSVLKKLKIPTPSQIPNFKRKENTDSIRDWADILINIAAQSRLRDLKAARSMNLQHRAAYPKETPRTPAQELVDRQKNRRTPPL